VSNAANQRPCSGRKRPTVVRRGGSSSTATTRHPYEMYYPEAARRGCLLRQATTRPTPLTAGVIPMPSCCFPGGGRPRVLAHQNWPGFSHGPRRRRPRTRLSMQHRRSASRASESPSPACGTVPAAARRLADDHQRNAKLTRTARSFFPVHTNDDHVDRPGAGVIRRPRRDRRKVDPP